MKHTFDNDCFGVTRVALRIELTADVCHLLKCCEVQCTNNSSIINDATMIPALKYEASFRSKLSSHTNYLSFSSEQDEKIMFHLVQENDFTCNYLH